MDQFSFLGNSHMGLIEHLYDKYVKNPEKVEYSWRVFFQGYDFSRKQYGEINYEVIPSKLKKEFNVVNLIDNYRSRGHLFTKTNPVRKRRKYRPKLDLANFSLSEQDLDDEFEAGSMIGIGKSKLRDIVLRLNQIYCESIGIEYMYIRLAEERQWIQNQINKNNNHPNFSNIEKIDILNKLSKAIIFERFLHTKFPGQKRFSLQGSEALIPGLDYLISNGINLGIKNFVIGMAHRGRLNVLANVLKKSYKSIFSLFLDDDIELGDYDDSFDGDVKYHQGWSSKIEDKDIILDLAPNPSHLESVSPVVQGIARAKIDNEFDGDSSKVLPIILHGDAAISGQGVIYEVKQMMTLDAYSTGGAIHIVINNQIGFTTDYLDGRTSTYCTDVAKVTLSPVIHVNSDDVEAVVHAFDFALKFRTRFKKDVFLDILGYRRYGHNEGDEPYFTQPLLYKIISTHPDAAQIYKRKIIGDNLLSTDKIDEIENSIKLELDNSLNYVINNEYKSDTGFMYYKWLEKTESNNNDLDVDTRVSISTIKDISKKLTNIPSDKDIFKKTKKLLKSRADMIDNNSIDWGMCELICYGSLIKEGHDVRLTGQDVERGTFSHRHSILKIDNSYEEINPLEDIDGGRVYIYNSLLSEYASLGFEYGYSWAAPNALNVWEAQFGDFANGAQIIIDQYISSASSKWKTQNGIVILLPHGYEGQGPEHSSARIERFLQLAAQNNMRICNCSTPANFFHLMREQVKKEIKKPLIIFTPKSLLRHPKCVSTLDDLSKGKFSSIIDDDTNKANQIERVVFCSGKIYYDLLTKRLDERKKNIALLRIEQLYPLPIQEMKSLIKKYPNSKDFIWVQEEPENMGCLAYMISQSLGISDEGEKLPIDLKYINRQRSASTATGSFSLHKKQQKLILDQVFDF